MNNRDIKKIANWYMRLQLVLEAEQSISIAQEINEICNQMSTECLVNSNLFAAWIKEIDKYGRS